MRTFLGVPILRAGRRYGNLYLTEKAGAALFDDTDEALVTALAAFAAGAIETAELLTRERSRAAAVEQARARRELLGQVIAAQEAERSEEHTSELQSLMRNSYAVFCLTQTTLVICNHQHHNRT